MVKRRKISRVFKSPVRRVVQRISGNELNEYSFGNALGIVSAIALLFYAVMSWFSSFSASVVVAKFPLYFSLTDWTLIIGVIQAYVMAYIGGWIFVKVYNRTNRR